MAGRYGRNGRKLKKVGKKSVDKTSKKIADSVS